MTALNSERKQTFQFALFDNFLKIIAHFKKNNHDMPVGFMM